MPLLLFEYALILAKIKQAKHIKIQPTTVFP